MFLRMCFRLICLSSFLTAHMVVGGVCHFQYQVIFGLQLHGLKWEYAGISTSKGRIPKIITYNCRLHLLDMFYLACKELSLPSGQRLVTAEFYTASCCLYMFALQVKAAIANSQRALWSVWHFSLYPVFFCASSWALWSALVPGKHSCWINQKWKSGWSCSAQQIWNK